MLTKTDAVVLRIVPYSETSHIVTWLSAEHGRVVTMMKGAQRPKSVFLGQYDLFWTCELVYYIRETGGIHIARDVSPLATRGSIRNQWRSSVTAGFVCDLAARLTTESSEASDTYRRVTDALDYLEDHVPQPTFVFWTELKLLAAAGFAPEFRHCVLCRTALQPSPGHVFSFKDGGCVCPDCRPRGGADAVLPMGPDVIALLRAWSQHASPRAAQNTRLTAEQILVCRDFFDRLFLYFSGSSLRSRGFVLDSLASTPCMEG